MQYNQKLFTEFVLSILCLIFSPYKLGCVNKNTSFLFTDIIIKVTDLEKYLKFSEALAGRPVS